MQCVNFKYVRHQQYLMIAIKVNYYNIQYSIFNVQLSMFNEIPTSYHVKGFSLRIEY